MRRPGRERSVLGLLLMPRFFLRRVRGEGRTLSRSDAMHSKTADGKCDFVPVAGYTSLDAGQDED